MDTSISYSASVFILNLNLMQASAIKLEVKERPCNSVQCSCNSEHDGCLLLYLHLHNVWYLV